jgi:hypothetical protein
MNYDYGYTQGERPMAEVNRWEWQTDFWQDVDIHFHPVLTDVAVIETRFTYCKDGNTYCAGTTMVTQDEQISTIFAAGQGESDPQFRGPYTDVAVYDPTMAAYRYTGQGGTPAPGKPQENWAATVQNAVRQGIGISVLNPGAGAYAPDMSIPAIAMTQPNLAGFEYSGVTEQPYTGDNAHHFAFTQGGWFKAVSFAATGGVDKIRWDLLRANEAHVSPYITGYVDVHSCSSVQGWAYDTRSPNAAINIRADIYDTNGNKLSSVTAPTTGARPDACPSGLCAYGVPISPPQTGPVIVKVYGVSNGVESRLNPGSTPYEFTCTNPNITLSAIPSPTTTGQFTLSWSASNFEKLTLNPGGIDVTNLSQYVVNITTATTYTLTATNAYSTVTAQATADPTVSAPPVITSFGYGPTLTPGQYVLNWSVTGAASLTLNNGAGTITTVTGTNLTVTPPFTSTYTLTATNVYGSVTSGPITLAAAKFHAGDSVTNDSSTTLYSYDGSLFVAPVGTVAAGSVGTVVSGTIVTFPGVQTYWQVNFTNGQSGWVQEAAIRKGP